MVPKAKRTKETQEQWVNWLASAEFWYNTKYHGAIRITTFQAMYGRPPLSSLFYGHIQTINATLDQCTQKFREKCMYFIHLESK